MSRRGATASWRAGQSQPRRTTCAAASASCFAATLRRISALMIQETYWTVVLHLSAVSIGSLSPSPGPLAPPGRTGEGGCAGPPGGGGGGGSTSPAAASAVAVVAAVPAAVVVAPGGGVAAAIAAASAAVVLAVAAVVATAAVAAVARGGRCRSRPLWLPVRSAPVPRTRLGLG